MKIKFFSVLALLSLWLTGCIQAPTPIATTPLVSAHYSGASLYRIKGKQYKVLSTREAKHYHAIGLATWYGKKFHHKRTASGKRYDMNQLTAAHKTLPFFTRAKVTNLQNKKEVIVIINDRGPFVKNRLIDLSYAAAKKLGLLRNQSARVEIKAVE